jgi:hypothetical protein
MEQSQSWYIVKRPEGHCEILSVASTFNDRELEQTHAPILERWGPYASADEAIARRVGLIRTGKCQPL